MNDRGYRGWGKGAKEVTPTEKRRDGKDLIETGWATPKGGWNERVVTNGLKTGTRKESRKLNKG